MADMVDVPNNEGKTPESLARDRGFPLVVRALRRICAPIPEADAEQQSHAPPSNGTAIKGRSAAVEEQFTIAASELFAGGAAYTGNRIDDPRYVAMDQGVLRSMWNTALD